MIEIKGVGGVSRATAAWRVRGCGAVAVVSDAGVGVLEGAREEVRWSAESAVAGRAEMVGLAGAAVSVEWSASKGALVLARGAVAKGGAGTEEDGWGGAVSCGLFPGGGAGGASAGAEGVTVSAGGGGVGEV